MELPDFLPSSFREKGNGTQLVYKIKATLMGSGSLYNYDCYLNINVKAQPLEKLDVKPFYVEPIVA